MNDLPDSWAKSAIGDLFEVVGGGTPDRSVESYWTGSIPWISSADISEAGYVTFRRSISEDAMKRSATNAVREGSVIVVTRVGLGKVATAPRIMTFSQDCQALLPVDGVEPEFLRLQLSRTALALRSVSRGTTISGVTKKQLLSLPVVLAPTVEQKRIVAAIEEQFSRLDAGVAALQQVERNINRMRAAVFSKLHDTALMSSSPTPLADVAEFIVDGDHNPPRRVAQGVPYLTARHVKDGRVSTEGASFISERDFASLRRRYDPHEGDVLVTCVGTLGEIAVVPGGLTFAADRNLAAIRPAPKILPSFLEATLRSPQLQKTLTAGSGSTAQPHLYLKDLRRLQIPVPDLGVQETLVAVLRDQLAIAAQLKSEVSAALNRSDRLRSSILAAAFSGTLVPQDPGDEPASALLERISADRTSHKRYPSRTREKSRLLHERVTA